MAWMRRGRIATIAKSTSVKGGLLMRQTCVVLCALAVTLTISSWQRSVDRTSVLGAAAEPCGLVLVAGVLLGASAWDRRRALRTGGSHSDSRAAAKSSGTPRGIHARPHVSGVGSAAQEPTRDERLKHPLAGHPVQIP